MTLSVAPVYGAAPASPASTPAQAHYGHLPLARTVQVKNLGHSSAQHPHMVLPFRSKKTGAELAAIKRATSRGTARTSGIRTVKAPLATTSTSSATPQFAIPGTTTMGITLDGQVNDFGYNVDVTPPDTQMAVGKTDILEMVNDSGEIWTKSGTPVTSFSLYSFFPAPAGFMLTDPRVFYDASTQRWFASAFALDASGDSQVYIATSSTWDATGTWSVYSTPITQGVITDQPMFGVNSDKVTISWNDFTTTSFLGQETWVLQKSDLLDGSATVASAELNFSGGNTPSPDPTRFRLVPAESMTSTTSEYVVYNNSDPMLNQNTPSPSLGVSRIDGTPAAGNVTWMEWDPTIQQGFIPPSAGEPGSDLIDTGDDRLLSAVWQNGSLWAAGNDACVPPGDSTAQSCIRLFGVNTTGTQPTITEDADFSMTPGDVYYPALALDGAGNLYYAYTWSSSTVPPSVLMIAPNGSTFDGPWMVAAGQAAYCGFDCQENGGFSRWGDYSAAATDPSDTSEIWVAGEYAATQQDPTNWGTAIGAMSLAPDQITMSPNPIAPTGSLKQNQSVNVTVTALNASGAPMPSSTVWLSFGGSAGSASVQGWPLTSNPSSFPTDTNGQIVVTYTLQNMLSGSVHDDIVAQDSATSPHVLITDSYTYTPMAPPASISLTRLTSPLYEGHQTTLSGLVLDANGNPVPGVQVDLSVEAGTLSTPSTTTSSTGAFAFGYTAPEEPCQCHVDATVNATALMADTVVQVVPVPAGTITISVNPSAVLSGGVGNITGTVDDTNGNPAPGEPVVLSAVDGTISPSSVLTGVDGTFASMYVAPQSLSAAETDTVTAIATSASNVTASQNVSLLPPSTAPIASIAMNPDPIAPDNSLSAGQWTWITVTAEGSNGPIPGATLYLSFTPGPGEGVASVGVQDGPMLNSTPQAFQADANGNVTVAYTAPSILSVSGTDTLIAQNALTNPSVVLKDTYTYAPAALATVTGLSQPASGPVAGGTVVTITGTNLTGTTSVKFGTASASFTMINGTEITAVSPPGSGTVDVTVTTPEGTSATGSADQFTYLNSGTFPSVTLQPENSVVAPGGTASITVDATAPPAGLGAWTVDLGYDASVASVLSCAPTNGSICNQNAGPDLIRITGASVSGLSATDPLATVTFQATGAAGSSTKLPLAIDTFADPSGAPISATPYSGSLQVAQPPAITSVTPNVSWDGGGVSLTITGERFTPGATVSIGGHAATVNSVSSDGTSIVAVAPSHGVLGDVNGDGSTTAVDALCTLRGVAQLPATTSCPAAAEQTSVDVVVTNTNGQNGLLSGGFTYNNADVNGDGSVTAVDALCTLRIVAGLPATAGCPRPPMGAYMASHLLRTASLLSVPVAVSSGLAPAGDTTSVTLSVYAPTSGVGAWTVDLAYNPSVIQPVSCSAQNGSLCNLSYANGILRVTGASMSGLSGQATLAVLTFKAEGTAGSSSPLTVTVPTLSDPAGNPLAAKAESGTVDVTSSSQTLRRSMLPLRR